MRPGRRANIRNGILQKVEAGGLVDGLVYRFGRAYMNLCEQRVGFFLFLIRSCVLVCKYEHTVEYMYVVSSAPWGVSETL